MISTGPHFHKLHETDKYIVGNEFEYAYLVNKKTNKETYIGGFHDDPVCALISANNDWCLIGGDMLYLVKLKQEQTIPVVSKETSVIRIKQTEDFKAQVLIGPRSGPGSIWELNVKTLEKKKVRTLDAVAETAEW